MALLGPTYAAANQARAHPAQFKGASVGGNPTGLDGVGKMAQSFHPTETGKDVSFRSAMQSHWHTDDSR
jgi:hypothetical protein